MRRPIICLKEDGKEPEMEEPHKNGGAPAWGVASPSRFRLFAFEAIKVEPLGRQGVHSSGATRILEDPGFVAQWVGGGGLGGLGGFNSR